MEHAALAMCLVTPEGRLQEVNDAACRLFGYDAETLKQKTWQELTPPEYLDKGLKDVTDLHEGRIDSFRITKQYIHADGHLIWVDRYRMAYDWEHYKPALRVEPDFKAFWDQTLAELRAIPLEPATERVAAFADRAGQRGGQGVAAADRVDRFDTRRLKSVQAVLVQQP